MLRTNLHNFDAWMKLVRVVVCSVKFKQIDMVVSDSEMLFSPSNHDIKYF